MEINKTAREKTTQCTFTWKGWGSKQEQQALSPVGTHMVLVWAVTARMAT